MALIYEIELFTQEHYKHSIAPDGNLSELYKDIFLYHWKEEAHHAYLDSLEWPLEDKRLKPLERERAIDELIELVGAVDGILQEQSKTDADYFLRITGRSFTEEQMGTIKACLLRAYRWQYIFSGVEHPRFQKLLRSLITEAQLQRIDQALSPLASL